MLKAVVFDMDDTLLSINLTPFCALWAADVTNIMCRISRKRALDVGHGLASAMYALNNNVRPGTDNRTNREFFNERILRDCGVDLNDPVVFEALDYYEREVLPLKNGPVISARPRKGAHEALETVIDRGLRIALFTNPSFSATGIKCRMGWGGLDDIPFERITTMENSTRCKPDAVYYLENLQEIGLEPQEVLMVGNDPKRDFPTLDCGIQTAYVGHGRPGRATWSGSMERFAADFDSVVDAFERKGEQGTVL